jgi:hypothetical protein
MAARSTRVQAAVVPVLRPVVVVACLACLQCGGRGNTPTGPTAAPTNPLPPGTPAPPTTAPPSAPQIFVGTGDIGWCGSPGPEQTARLVDTIGGTVFAVGDLAYFSGTRQEFLDCYDPSWGRHKSRTRPVPGNHEYMTPGASPYFDYFGALAGPSGLGYYSFELGEWHAVALNSLVPVNDGSAQAQWLRGDLAMSHSKCTIAYWHYPLFTSGPNGSQTQMRDFWRILYGADVDIVVNGHDHLYERFAPQNPDGGRDDARGIREFIVGTGGASLYNFVTASANSEARISNTYGVLKLTLQSGSYQWEFIPVSGQSDFGNGSCH